MHNIRPCWWGSHLWQTIYFITAVYPENPNREEIDNMKCFFKSLRYFLPCEGCKNSYCKFSGEKDTMIENSDNFKSKHTLIEFVFRLRQKVNEKLSHEYHINLNYFKRKLNYMLINQGYKNDGNVCEMIEAPFIPVNLETKVLLYLKTNTNYDPEYTKKLLEISINFMKNNPVFDSNNKYFKFLYKRHQKCRNIINKINHNMSNGDYDLLESFKKYDKNLHEKLLFLGCTIIHQENLEKLLTNKNKII